MLTGNFETGVNSSSVLTTDAGSASAWDYSDASTNVKYDNTHVAHGTLSAKSNSGAVGWTTKFATQTDHYGRAYHYLTAVPNNLLTVVYLTCSGGIIRFGIDTSGHFIIINNLGTTVKTSTLTVALNQWMRFEFHVLHSLTVGVMEMKLFNTSMDASTPDETITQTAMDTFASSSEIYFGNATEASESAPMWIDDIAAAATSYPGPAATAAYQPRNAGVNFQNPAVFMRRASGLIVPRKRELVLA